jgi:hypothetical protein
LHEIIKRRGSTLIIKFYIILFLISEREKGDWSDKKEREKEREKAREQ